MNRPWIVMRLGLALLAPALLLAYVYRRLGIAY